MKRMSVLTIACCLAVLSCTSDPAENLAPSRSSVVEAWSSTGLSASVAECVVGLGEREFNLDELSPGAPTDAVTEALVDEIVANCEQAAAILDAPDEEPEVLALDPGPQRYGDDPRLDFLWDRCEEGDGRACDRLWQDAPIGSAYETFGVTCGERPDILDCAVELVLEDEVVDDGESVTD